MVPWPFSIFFQCCKDCFFIFQLFQVLLQFTENFFVFSLHPDYLFQLILYSLICFMACPVTPSQVSHHSFQHIFALAYIIAPVKSPQKSLSSFSDKSFHPTRLCLYLPSSQAIPSQVSTPKYRFLSFKWGRWFRPIVLSAFVLFRPISQPHPPL